MCWRHFNTKPVSVRILLSIRPEQGWHDYICEIYWWYISDIYTRIDIFEFENIGYFQNLIFSIFFNIILLLDASAKRGTTTVIILSSQFWNMQLKHKPFNWHHPIQCCKTKISKISHIHRKYQKYRKYLIFSKISDSFENIRYFPSLGQSDFGSDRIWIQTGSTKSTGYPARFGSGPGSGASLDEALASPQTHPLLIAVYFLPSYFCKKTDKITDHVTTAQEANYNSQIST